MTENAKGERGKAFDKGKFNLHSDAPSARCTCVLCWCQADRSPRPVVTCSVVEAVHGTPADALGHALTAKRSMPHCTALPAYNRS